MNCPKISCEVCGEKDKATLHYHHIVERTEVKTCNNDFNIAVICSNCHNKIHHGQRLKIIGVFPSTGISGRTLVYELDGVCNVEGLTEAYFNHKPAQMKIYFAKEDNE